MALHRHAHRRCSSSSPNTGRSMRPNGHRPYDDGRRGIRTGFVAFPSQERIPVMGRERRRILTLLDRTSTTRNSIPRSDLTASTIRVPMHTTYRVDGAMSDLQLAARVRTHRTVVAPRTRPRTGSRGSNLVSITQSFNDGPRSSSPFNQTSLMLDFTWCSRARLAAQLDGQELGPRYVRHGWRQYRCTSAVGDTMPVPRAGAESRFGVDASRLHRHRQLGDRGSYGLRRLRFALDGLSSA